MSWALVRPLAIGAIGLITASAVEKGFRHGTQKANTDMALWDANVLMNETSTSSDDFIIDGVGNALRNQVHYNTGVLSGVNRFWGGIKGTIGSLAEKIVPLGIAAGSFAVAKVAPKLGAVGLGILAIWGAASVIQNSGLVKNRGSNVLDLKM